ncbi:MAG: hypothetical protein AAF085_15710 [Planctomycetota bacterium]
MDQTQPTDPTQTEPAPPLVNDQNPTTQGGPRPWLAWTIIFGSACLMVIVALLVLLMMP